MVGQRANGECYRLDFCARTFILLLTIQAFFYYASLWYTYYQQFETNLQEFCGQQNRFRQGSVVQSQGKDRTCQGNPALFQVMWYINTLSCVRDESANSKPSCPDF